MHIGQHVDCYISDRPILSDKIRQQIYQPGSSFNSILRENEDYDVKMVISTATHMTIIISFKIVGILFDCFALILRVEFTHYM